MGKKYLVEFDYKFVDNANLVSANVQFGGNVEAEALNPQQTTWAKYSTVQLAKDLSTPFRIYVSASGQAGNELLIDNVSVTQIGNVLDLQPKSVGTNGWIDTSGNNLHANSSGTPQANGTQVPRDVRVNVATDTKLTGTVTAGHILTLIKVTNNNSVDQNINVGTLAFGGTEVINDQTIAANSTVVFLTADWFSDTVDQDLYVSDGTGGWDAGADLTILMNNEPQGA